jgi:CRP-like cAMP-binding protein
MAEAKQDAKPARADPMQRIRKLAREVQKLIEPLPLFAGLNVREQALFAEIAEVVRCAGGVKVFDGGEEGRYLYIVVQGRLELKTPTGAGLFYGVREIVAGRPAGIDAVLMRAPYHMTCVALEPTAALRFQTAHLHKMLDNAVPAAIKLFTALRAEMGDDIRAATLEVVQLLEQTSVRGPNAGR